MRIATVPSFQNNIHSDNANARQGAQENDSETPLRILLAYVDTVASREARSWRALMERQRLLDTFEACRLPEYNVEVGVLCHLVTKKLLSEKIRSSSGYDIIHLNGYDSGNALEIQDESGQISPLDAAELVGLFRSAGGYLPSLVFLSLRRLTAPEANQDGNTFDGTSLASNLHDAGVGQVVTVHNDVGDYYVQDLASHFYARLLANGSLQPTEEALDFAKHEAKPKLLKSRPHAGAIGAEPMLFGNQRLVVGKLSKRKQNRRSWKAHVRQYPEGSPQLGEPETYGGYSRELAWLRQQWTAGGARSPAITLIHSPPELECDTQVAEALVNEAIYLWHEEFGRILIFKEAEPELTIETFYEQIAHICENNKVYLHPSEQVGKKARMQRMQTALLEILQDESVLLVIEHFENSLFPIKDGTSARDCKDSDWTKLFDTLAQELPETRSRLLITSTSPITQLSDPEMCLTLSLRQSDVEQDEDTVDGACRHEAFRGRSRSEPDGSSDVPPADSTDERKKHKQHSPLGSPRISKAWRWVLLLIMAVLIMCGILVYAVLMQPAPPPLVPDAGMDAGANEPLDARCNRDQWAACTELGIEHECQQDDTSAQEPYRRACDRGDDAFACYRFARLGFSSDNPTEASRSITNSYYERACELDSAGACIHVGEILEKSGSHENAEKRIMELYSKACKLGHPRGCYKYQLFVDLKKHKDREQISQEIEDKLRWMCEGSYEHSPTCVDEPDQSADACWFISSMYMGQYNKYEGSRPSYLEDRVRKIQKIAAVLDVRCADNDARSCRKLGEMLRYDDFSGVLEQDNQRGSSLLEDACKLGDTGACDTTNIGE